MHAPTSRSPVVCLLCAGCRTPFGPSPRFHVVVDVARHDDRPALLRHGPTISSSCVYDTSMNTAMSV